MVQIHDGMLLSHKKETNAICSKLDDLEIIILSEVSQTKINMIPYAESNF